MKKIISYSFLIISTAVLCSCGNTAETDAKDKADSTNNAKIDNAEKADTGTQNKPMADMEQDASFATAAADGGMMEVELGKMAVSKGVSPAIKKLGAMMVKDHSAANAELKTAAAAKNITLPTALSEKCQKTVADLTEKKGADFDKAYADLMVSDHKEDIDLFNKQADKGTDKDLAAWAKGKVPVLQHHLQMAEETKKAVDK